MDNAWQVRTYGSGTVIVTTGLPHEPHLYVYGPRNEDETKGIHQRYYFAKSLAEFLNGGLRPPGLDDLYRTTETHAESIDYASIDATGPMIDRDPPNLDWIIDPATEMQDARARLMDRLFLESPA